MEKSPYKDYYYILGVSQDATTQEIQEAYNDLYQKYGPHVTLGGLDPDSQIKAFRDLSEAYEVLMDPEKRREYDKNCAPHLQKGDLRALWTKFTGVGGGPKEEKKPKAVDTDQEIEVTLKEAVKGCTRQVRLEEPKPCDSCQGLKPVQRMQCPNCRGLGYTMSERIEEVELPAGLYEKAEVRKPALGKYDLQANARGDLILRVKLRPHQFLGVLGRDITLTVPVTVYEAVLGAEIEVPTATGKVIMKIQPLTQPGRVYRLKGLGLGGADQLVTVEVVLPQRLSDEEKRLFMRLQELSGNANPREAMFRP